MLRLIHSQTIAGAILVDDIDDGLPNKEVYRLGTTADPKAYPRDGYANKPKQVCYLPPTRATAGFPGVPGYIDLQETENVILSAGKGKIHKLALPPAGGPTPLLSVVALVAADIVAPVITGATTVGPNFQITGTTLVSVTPDTTTVVLAQGAGATAPNPAVWTQAAILGAGGAILPGQITIPTAAFVTAPVVDNTLVVQANEQNSNSFVST